MRSYAEPRPHPIRLGEILEKLEPLGHDFEFHALLRSQDFEVRDAVMQAASVFDDYADRVPEWWRQLEPFTRLPDAGGDP